MTRREFMLGSLGLVSSAALGGDKPAEEPSIFSRRGKWERLTLSYQHVPIGLEAPFSILHISDTHLTAAYPHEPPVKQKLAGIRTATFGGQQEQALADSLAWAKKNVDCVLHTGDLIDWQSEANFDLARKYFGDIALVAVGNHEYSRSMWLADPKETPTEAFKAESSGALAAACPFDVSFHTETVKGVNFVMLDDVYGTVTERQVERFAAEVKKGLPIVLCMHVPIYTDLVWRATCKYWRGGKRYTSSALPEPGGDCLRQRTDKVTQDFVAMLKSEKLLKAVLAGHLHLAVQDRISPTAMQYVVGGNYLFHGQEVLFT